MKFPVPPEFLDVCSGIQFPSPPTLPVEVVPEFVGPVVEKIEEEEQEEVEASTDPLIVTESDGEVKEVIPIRQPSSMPAYSRCNLMICG